MPLRESHRPQRLGRATEAGLLYRRSVAADSRYLDCDAMRKQFYWSIIACDTAASLIVRSQRRH